MARKTGGTRPEDGLGAGPDAFPGQKFALLLTHLLITIAYQAYKKVPFDRGPGLPQNRHLRMAGVQFSVDRLAASWAGQALPEITSSGEEAMIRLNANSDPRNAEQFEIVMQAVEEALYYPSLKDGSWDDELLPSGD